ncbi:MAG: GreA/GreB family elongation factor [Patescibacteria group bacterium]
MRTTDRKPKKLAPEPDFFLTEKKYTELGRTLAGLKKIQPQMAAEVARLGEMGDFSENAEYQLAKGRLRGINNRILKLQYQLDHAVIIAPAEATDTVQIGNSVMIEHNGRVQTYRILGSSETNPNKGVISHNSPLGAALLGHRVGDAVTVRIAGKETVFTLLEIQ